MAKIELKSRSEKLTYIRQILNITQKELAGENLTREFISMIEGAKRNMSRDVAVTIMKNAINYAKDKGIPLDLDEEFIARTEEEDLCKLCDELQNTMETMDFCNEIMDYAEKNNFPWAKIIATKKIGNIFFINKEVDKAYEKYISCLNMIDRLNSNKLKEVIYTSIGNVKLKRMQYEEALIYYKEALSYCYINDNVNVKNNINYNIASVYHNLGDFNKSLKIIEEMLNEDLEKPLVIKCTFVMANNYKEMNLVSKALIIYEELLNDDLTSNDFKSMIYNNMALSYMDNNDYENSNKYFDLALVSAKFNPTIIYKFIVGRGHMYIKFGQYKEARKVLNEGVDFSKIEEDYEYEIKYLKELYSLAQAEKNNQEMIKIAEKILKLARKNNIKDEVIWATNSLIEIARHKKDINILNNI